MAHVCKRHTCMWLSRIRKRLGSPVFSHFFSVVCLQTNTWQEGTLNQLMKRDSLFFPLQVWKRLNCILSPCIRPAISHRTQSAEAALPLGGTNPTLTWETTTRPLVREIIIAINASSQLLLCESLSNQKTRGDFFWKREKKIKLWTHVIPAKIWC